MVGFDWHEMRRFGIDEARLPVGAVGREPRAQSLGSVQRTVIVIGAVLAGQFLLIGGLLFRGGGAGAPSWRSAA